MAGIVSHVSLIQCLLPISTMATTNTFKTGLQVMKMIYGGLTKSLIHIIRMQSVTSMAQVSTTITTTISPISHLILVCFARLNIHTHTLQSCAMMYVRITGLDGYNGTGVDSKIMIARLLKARNPNIKLLFYQPADRFGDTPYVQDYVQAHPEMWLRGALCYPCLYLVILLYTLSNPVGLV